MTNTLVLNLIGSLVIVGCLVGACRLAFLAAGGRFDTTAERPTSAEESRLAA